MALFASQEIYVSESLMVTSKLRRKRFSVRGERSQGVPTPRGDPAQPRSAPVPAARPPGRAGRARSLPRASIWDHLPQEGQGRMWFGLDKLSAHKRRQTHFVFHPDSQTQDIISLLVFLRKTWWSQRKYDNKRNTPSSVTSKTSSEELK